MKIVVSYDKEVTDKDQQNFDDFAKLNTDIGNEVEGIGGGIKNMKP